MSTLSEYIKGKQLYADLLIEFADVITEAKENHQLYEDARIFSYKGWINEQLGFCHYNYGKRDNPVGPAYFDGEIMMWYTNGMLSRLDGPAVITSGGHTEYWIYNHRYSLDEWLDFNPTMSRADKVLYKMQWA